MMTFFIKSQLYRILLRIPICKFKKHFEIYCCVLKYGETYRYVYDPKQIDAFFRDFMAMKKEEKVRSGSNTFCLGKKQSSNLTVIDMLVKDYFYNNPEQIKFEYL